MTINKNDAQQCQSKQRILNLVEYYDTQFTNVYYIEDTFTVYFLEILTRHMSHR